MLIQNHQNQWMFQVVSGSFSLTQNVHQRQYSLDFTFQLELIFAIPLHGILLGRFLVNLYRIKDHFLRNVSNLSRKVSQLLDSFRPGSSSYSPFQNKTDENNNESNSSNDNVEENSEFHLQRPSEIRGRVSEGTNPQLANETVIQPHEVEDPEGLKPENNESNTLSREEENRRRLYLNLGRPRPFYRTTSRDNQSDPEPTIPAKQRKKPRLLSLQECSRNEIVSAYGLKNIRKLLEDTGSSIKLPEKIRNYLFTFPCHEFEVNLITTVQC